MEQPSTNLRWVYDMDDLLAQKEPVGMLDKPDHIPQDFWNTVLYGIHHECEAYAYGSVVLQQPYKNHPMRLFTLDGSLYFCKEDMHAVLDNPNPLMKIIRRDEEWLHLNDVLALLVFSPDYRLCLWIEKMYHTYIDNQNDTFDFMMMAFHQVTLDNHMRRMKSLRSHFRKSLPSLIPGATILKKRSCLTKGRVSMFVQVQDKMCPVELSRTPIGQHHVDVVRQALNGYTCETGYLVGPALQDGVELDDNMVFVELD